MTSYVIHTDGGARGNPGPAGAGVVIAHADGSVLAELAVPLGTMTNNQAEYWAVIHALTRLQALITEADSAPDSVMLNLDSQLVAEQLAGNYKVKNQGLRPLYDQARNLIDSLDVALTIQYIPRRKNVRADALANQAMDELESQRT